MTEPKADNSLVASVVRAVKARGSVVTNADQAAVDLAMRYATQIDAGIEAGGQDATKALYLGPHLLNTLRALGCTPEARNEAGESPGGESSSPQSKLAALRARRGAGGGA